MFLYSGRPLAFKFFAALLFSLPFVQPSSANAQEYPYDDAPADSEEVGGPRKLPKESPDESISASAQKIRKKGYRSSWALKAGVNYTYIQYPSASGVTLTDKSVGGEGLIALGNDLAYQPIYLEVETGYRSLLTTLENKIHVIPLRLGVFYRSRIADTSLWRPGLVSSLDFRFSKNTDNKYDKALVPSLGISSMWEFNRFLIEGVLNIHRIESQFNFFDLSFRLGLRL